MLKRKRDSDSSDSDSFEADSGDDYTPSWSPKASIPSAKTKAVTPKKPSKAAKPSTKAEILKSDVCLLLPPCADPPGPDPLIGVPVDSVDSAVIGRIKKALALAKHEQTGEAEARAALRMAHKLLEQHNVTQADIMSQETESEQLKRAGISLFVVSIKNTNPTVKEARLERWAGCLGSAMRTYFDCQLYTTVFDEPAPKVDFSFYGLEEQTVTAALAFETIYNLILVWSLEPKAGKGRHTKNCYRTGVANGLLEMAKKEKKEDMARAKQKEQALLKARQEEEAAEDKSRLDRLKEPEVKNEESAVEEPERPVKSEETDVRMEDRRVKVEEVEDEEDLTVADDSGEVPDPEAEYSDGEDFPFTDSFEAKPDFNDADDVENLLDLDAEKPTLKKSKTASPPPEPKVKLEPEEDESSWKSVGALVAFQESAISVGDNLLKSMGVKLVKGRKSKGLEFKDEEARRLYKQGKQDARKIDVRQKRLKAAEMDD